MNNQYLRDRRSRRVMSRDMRNPYGSRGGYVTSRRGRDRAHEGMDYGMDYARGEYRDRNYSSGDYRYGDSRYDMGMERSGQYDGHNGYEMYAIGAMRPMYEDYGYDMRSGSRYDRNYDMRGNRDYGCDYGSGEEEKEYEHMLKETSEKLKKKDRFGWSKDQVVEQAKSMGVKFKEFDEMEYYVVYLMMLSDYPKVANEPHTYLSMAKEWLEDDDVKLKGSDKLCAYLYTIVYDK